MSRLFGSFLLGVLVAAASFDRAAADETRLLRQPSLSAQHVVFAHGGDLWIVERSGGQAVRLTSTPAVESDPHFSPDGASIAFTSNRSGTPAVWIMPATGGAPTRLTWYPAPAFARGFTPDGSRVLYATTPRDRTDGFSSAMDGIDPGRALDAVARAVGL